MRLQVLGRCEEALLKPLGTGLKRRDNTLGSRNTLPEEKPVAVKAR